MRKSILILALYLLSTGAAAEWFRVTGSVADGFDSYIATTTIRPSGDRVKLQVLNNFKSPVPFKPKPYLSWLVDLEFDCKNHHRRILYGTFYTNNMAKGDVIESYTDMDWTPIRPNTLLEPHFKAACGTELVKANESWSIVEAIGTIRLKYVESAQDKTLVAGCRDGISHRFSEFRNLVAAAEGAATDASPARDQITQMLVAIRQQSNETVSEKELIDACLRGMIGALGQQSTYLNAEEFKEVQVGSAPLGGIGVEMRIVDELPRIVLPFPDAPANRAGLKVGDVIVTIDAAPTRGVSLGEVARRLRGPVDSSVELEVTREGVTHPIRVSLTREVIRIQSVKWKWVGPGYAYVRILAFRDNTVARLTWALQTLHLESQGELKGLILDLRNNSGGLLNACVGVSAAFLPEGVLVATTAGRAEDSRNKLTANAGYYLRSHRDRDPLKDLPRSIKSIPLAVLVDHITASGAEIVAAALQDHKRAKIFGVRTFGQGTIATILPLHDGTALKLATAKFYRPTGASIDGAGVTPDVVLAELDRDFRSFGSEDDLQLGIALKHVGR